MWIDEHSSGVNALKLSQLQGAGDLSFPPHVALTLILIGVYQKHAV